MKDEYATALRVRKAYFEVEEASETAHTKPSLTGNDMLVLLNGSDWTDVKKDCWHSNSTGGCLFQHSGVLLHKCHGTSLS